MRFHVDQKRVRDLQLVAISNPNLDIATEQQIIATFTPTITTRITKIKIYYDEQIAGIEDLELSLKIKDAQNFSFVSHCPLHTIGNRKGGQNNHFDKIAFLACHEKEEIILTPSLELQVLANNRFTLPERKIFLLIDHYKDIA